MNKKIVSLLLLPLSVQLGLAYNANFTNQTEQTISLKAAGNVLTTISPNSHASLELDPYTAYAFSYKGQWSDQGLGTIQKYSNLVYQIVPVNRVNGISNIQVNIQADGNNGYVDNVNDASGNNVYGGLCAQDMGGITCTLAQQDKIKQLDIVFSPVQ